MAQQLDDQKQRNIVNNLKMKIHPDIKNNGSEKSFRFKTFELKNNSFYYYYVVLPSDIDQFKHMSFANYIKLMFLASDALFLAVLGKDRIFQSKIKLSHSALSFKKQSVIGDEIVIKVDLVSISDKKIVLNFTYRFLNTDDEVAFGWQSYEVSELSPNSSVTRLFEMKIQPIDGNDRGIDYDRQIFIDQRAKNIYEYEKIKVYFKHTDYYGGLHPYNYFEWTSHVREAFFSDKCSNFEEVLKSSLAMMTSKIELQILKDSYFADDLEARLTAMRVKKVSCDLVINYYDKTAKEFVATTTHTLVFFDPMAMRFTQIPETLRPAMVEYSEP